MQKNTEHVLFLNIIKWVLKSSQDEHWIMKKQQQLASPHEIITHVIEKKMLASKIVYDLWPTNQLLFTCCFFICHRIITEIDLIIVVEGTHINFMSLRIINQSIYTSFQFISNLSFFSSYPTVYDPYHWIIVCLLFHFNFVLFTWKAYKYLLQ